MSDKVLQSAATRSILGIFVRELQQILLVARSMRAEFVMRKSDLVVYIADTTDISTEKAYQVMSAILDEITNALSRDQSVNLLGFGSFEKRHRAARTGKNPQTGAPIAIDASNTVGFKPGRALRDALK